MKNKLMIDDRSIAKPPYSGPKKSQLKNKRLSPKEIKVMIAKLLRITTNNK